MLEVITKIYKTTVFDVGVAYSYTEIDPFIHYRQCILGGNNRVSDANKSSTSATPRTPQGALTGR